METKKYMYEESTTESPLDLHAPISAHIHRMTPDDWRQQYIEDHMNCVLCGKELQFSHQTNFSTLEVEEEAHCMACRIHAKTEHYSLQ